MLGDVRLPHPCSIGKLPHRHLTLSEFMQDLEPPRIGKDLADLRLQSEDTLIRGRLHAVRRIFEDTNIVIEASPLVSMLDIDRTPRILALEGECAN